MVITYKDYIGGLLKGKKLRMKGDCLLAMDITGTCVDYTLNRSEIIYIVDTGDRLIKVGENTPGLKIEIL